MSSPATPPVTPSRLGPAGYVAKLTRASGTNFFYAFLSLPKERREAIFAVYAFCHAVDDAVDEAATPEDAARQLTEWRAELARVYAGTPQHPVARELAVAVERFGLPQAFLAQVIDGVAMDLAPRRFATWDELAGYCDLVANAVGRLSVRIFGAGDEQADRYAAALGTALQVTNILRDLGPDARLGRFYLPLEDLARFGLTEADVLRPGADPRRTELLRFEAGRARAFYEEAARLVRGRERVLCAAEIMGAIYRKLLDEVERRGFPLAEPVVRLSRPRKGVIAIRTWLRVRRAPSAR